MKILLTGASGYIGKRLLPVLVAKGYTVVCCVRDISRFSPPELLKPNLEIVEADLLDHSFSEKIPKDINGAFYLVHSMSSSNNYSELELQSARNFRTVIEKTSAEHVVYLSGIVNEDALSEHLNSRKMVEDELSKGKYNFTTLRAGIIIGSGSASFEIIRDLVEKLPIMVAPKWLKTKCQPIGIKDVISFLEKSLFNKNTYNHSFDIGGPEVLSYKEMLLGYAKVRGLKRWIYIVPVMTPKLSSYWLYFITATSYRLASALVGSMKINVICRNNRLSEILNISTLKYETALERTFSKIDSNDVLSSWKDSFISGRFNQKISEFMNVPTYGCFKDKRVRSIKFLDSCIDKIWSIGGENGWYYGNWLWKIRGYLDKLFGGVGLRRGRTSPTQISAGDAIDFWRVLYADKKEGRLLLYAEMKLPGEAWLEFKVKDNELYQTATFRPRGLFGRLYWYSVLPFHELIFKGLINYLTK